MSGLLLLVTDIGRSNSLDPMSEALALNLVDNQNNNAAPSPKQMLKNFHVQVQTLSFLPTTDGIAGTRNGDNSSIKSLGGGLGNGTRTCLLNGGLGGIINCFSSAFCGFFDLWIVFLVS